MTRWAINCLGSPVPDAIPKQLDTGCLHLCNDGENGLRH